MVYDEFYFYFFNDENSIHISNFQYSMDSALEDLGFWDFSGKIWYLGILPLLKLIF